MSDYPVILGGQPITSSPIRFAHPQLPGLDEVSAELQEILSSGMVTKGQKLRDFEVAVAAHLGVKHAIAVSSCTTGLMLTYQALGLADEVIVPSFTFMATVTALTWVGCQPVFADVHSDSFNLNPRAVEELITERTTAIVAVHNFGNPAQIDELRNLADHYHLHLIFDAAHGFGALYKGVPVGAQGDAQVFSLSPTKLVVAGEGGIVATNHDRLAEQIRAGREYGNDGSYDCLFPGMNARMPEFNAILGRRSLEKLGDSVEHRNRIANVYRQNLSRIPGIEFQHVAPGNRCSYKDFAILIRAEAFGLTRDQLADALHVEGIDTRKYYTPVVHHQTAFRHYDRGYPLPVTERLEAEALSLPMWSDMPEIAAIDVSEAIRRIHDHAYLVRTTLEEGPYVLA